MAKPISQLGRLKNTDYREREYLTEREINQIMKSAKSIGRHGHRDATIILLAYRHGLRVSKLVRLKWLQVDFFQGKLYVHRRKNGVHSTHPLADVELRALRKQQREYPENPFVFISERKAPLTEYIFRKLLTRAAKVANIKLAVHPHMLRHSTGFKLANDGKDTRSIQHYLGHRSIQNTMRYTELSLSSERFNNFWMD